MTPSFTPKKSTSDYRSNRSPTNENETVRKKNLLLLPYQGNKGIGLIKSLKRNLRKHLPNSIKMQVTFLVQKLITQFNVYGMTNLNII